MKKYIIIIILIILVISSWSLFFSLKRKERIIDEEFEQELASFKTNDEYREYNIDSLKSIIYYNSDLEKYESHLYSLEEKKEININDIIKNKDKFYEKIREFISLKYPNYISDILRKLDHHNVYALKNNSLVIYFYDYDIVPKPEFSLSLEIKYQDLKDYFKIKIDSIDKTDIPFIDYSKKLVAFSFDDGPGSYTKEVVDTLKSNHAEATFFMLGSKLEKYQEEVLYVNQNNNEIGYHSWNHENLKRETIEQIKEEYNKANDILNNLIGKRFSLFRPPYGDLNKEIKENIDAVFILWNIDTLDWQHKDPEYLKNYVLENVQEGSIVLFHDIHKTTLEALKLILPELYNAGYQVVSVSSLAKAYNKELNLHSSYRHFTK